jgi:hypothetical protein
LKPIESKWISPFGTSSGLASVLSTTTYGREIVSMPSCTMPMFSKMLVTRFKTQPDICVMRSTSAVTSAIAPSVTLLRVQSNKASPVVPAMSRPFITNKMPVITVVSRT